MSLLHCATWLCTSNQRAVDLRPYPASSIPLNQQRPIPKISGKK